LLGFLTSGLPALAHAAYTFTWAYLYPRQTPLEHLIVYWLAPVASGFFGGLAFRGYQAFQAERAKQQQQPAARQVAKQQRANGKKDE
jgi:hypothetical protein